MSLTPDDRFDHEAERPSAEGRRAAAATLRQYGEIVDRFAAASVQMAKELEALSLLDRTDYKARPRHRRNEFVEAAGEIEAEARSMAEAWTIKDDLALLQETAGDDA